MHAATRFFKIILLKSQNYDEEPVMLFHWTIRRENQNGPVSKLYTFTPPLNSIPAFFTLPYPQGSM